MKRRNHLKNIPTSPSTMLIWTTTPWTLPANLAIAIHPDFTYVAIETGKEIYIALKDLTEDIAKRAGINRL